MLNNEHRLRNRHLVFLPKMLYIIAKCSEESKPWSDDLKYTTKQYNAAWRFLQVNCTFRKTNSSFSFSLNRANRSCFCRSNICVVFPTRVQGSEQVFRKLAEDRLAHRRAAFDLYASYVDTAYIFCRVSKQHTGSCPEGYSDPSDMSTRYFGRAV